MEIFFKTEGLTLKSLIAVAGASPPIFAFSVFDYKKKLFKNSNTLNLKNSNKKSFDLNHAGLSVSQTDFAMTVELTFKGNIRGKEINIFFEKCRFQKGVRFNFNITETSLLDLNIFFDDCIFGGENENHIIQCNQQVHRIIISFYACFIKQFSFSTCILTNISIHQSIIVEGLIVTNSTINTIAIRNSFGNYVITKNSNSTISITYSDDNLKIKEYLSRMLVKELKELYNINHIYQFKTSYILADGKDINIGFNKSEKSGIKRNIEFNKKKEHQFYFKSSDQQMVDISLSVSFIEGAKQRVKVSNGQLSNLTLVGESNSTIEVRHTKINRVFIHDFSCSRLIIYDLASHKTESLFELKNSDLTNGWLNKVSLKSFNTVSFYNTTIENTIFSATSFPDNIEAIENIHYPDNKEKEYFNNQYETYKQLKIALLNQHNHIQALQMHSKMYDAIRKSETVSGQDRFILFLNHWSNKHGTSISYAFFTLILVLILVFFSFNLSLPHAPYQVEWQGLKTFISSLINTGHFIFSNWQNAYILANPTHRISTLIENNPCSELSGMNYFISFFSRIMMGWAYFQFISAFRKFGKKI